MEKFNCPASGGEIKIEGGPAGNNGDETTIEVRGAQFGCSKLESTEDGFRLTIVGSWEIKEFASALRSFLNEEVHWVVPTHAPWVPGAEGTPTR